ncbi:MAG: hypothetical protein LUC25_00475 [Ruminococcus sp.]|nr:hypothetical protein [Ruminococcus sp.]
MKALLMSIVLILFVVMLIYIVSCLLRSVKSGEKSVGFLVIPINNKTQHISKGVKKAFWDEAFKEDKARSIILLKTESIDHKTQLLCDELAASYKLVEICDIPDFLERIKE